tara:strand:+ start:162 stop:635 length:474 start_codon:yes stop_codon:yes gene_type:complete
MLEILIFGFVILAATSLWVLIEKRRSPKFLLWFIPVLLIMVSSTYVTYTSLLGLPKMETPKSGIYLEYFVDEPNWIYLWVVREDKIPRSYQLVYSRKLHKSLEGVEQQVQEGNFMVLEESNEGQGDGEEGDKGEGYTIGGDISFYKWDYENELPDKD